MVAAALVFKTCEPKTVPEFLRSNIANARIRRSNVSHRKSDNILDSITIVHDFATATSWIHQALVK